MEDQIILFWDRAPEFVKGCRYCVRYGNKLEYTDKTHFCINNFLTDRFVDLSIYLVDGEKKIIKEFV